ncbi:MAG: hypothetical protein EBX52_05935 [Proteobacteria bacterium]|nr:hypothetical protein [Pseudomonadota bacterium]
MAALASFHTKIVGEPSILAHFTSLKIFFFWEGVMTRPPILIIQASSSLTEELLLGTETFLRGLREVVMENFGVVFTEVLNCLSVNLSS